MQKKSQKKCTVCNQTIREKIHFWSHKPMCKNCYAYHARRVIKTSNLIRRLTKTITPANAPRHQVARSWFRRIFG